ncbi:MAG: ABC transporter family substrate-binding protein [Sciscionella sp.]
MRRAQRRWPLLTAALAVGAMVLSACGGGQSGDKNAQVREMGTADINAQPLSNIKDGGSLKLALSQWPQQWNYNQVDGASVDLNTVYRAMMPEPFINQPDGTVKINKNLLESAKLTSNSPEVVEYKINPKARWSTGQPITWNDFKADWVAQNGKNPAYQPASTTGWDSIKSVEKGASDRDVKITFAKKFAEWKGLTTFLFPASEYKNPQMFNKGWISKIRATAGPFRVKKLDNTANTLTIERDPNWWGPKPKLDSITFRVVATTEQPQSFQEGAIDAVDIGPDVATFQSMRNNPNAEVRKALAPDWRVLNFSAKPGTPLSDPKVRAAMFRGIDRAALGKATIGQIVPDVRPLENHIYVEGQKGYEPTGKAYDHNPAEAKKELDAAGWKLPAGKQVRQKNGKQLTVALTIPSDTSISKNEGLRLQEQLKQIGVNMTLKTVDLNAWQSQYLTVGNFQLLNMTWEGTPFPVSSSSSIYTYNPKSINQNFGRVPDTTGVNALFAKANSELDDQKRMQLGNDIDKAIWHEAFSLPLYQRPDAWGVRKDLANFGAFGFSEPDWTKVGFMKQ